MNRRFGFGTRTAALRRAVLASSPPPDPAPIDALTSAISGELLTSAISGDGLTSAIGV